MSAWTPAKPANSYLPNTKVFFGALSYFEAGPLLQVAAKHRPQWGSVDTFLVLRPCCGYDRYLTEFVPGGIKCSGCSKLLPYSVEWHHAVYLDNKRNLPGDLAVFEAWCGVSNNALDAALLALDLRNTLLTYAEASL